MSIILHVDLDAFFASCEKMRNPELRGKPVVVCVYSGRGKESGAVSAADYSAREHGIHAGMPIREARKRAEEAEEDIAFLGVDKDFYSEVSGRVMDILSSRADELEEASVDEAYADISSLDGFEEAEETAREIKTRIEEEEGLTASIGIGPNKLLAKIASDREKPDGLTVVEPVEVDEFLDGLPVEEVHGIGPKTAERLEDLSVETVDEMRELDRGRLVREFGEKRGISLHEKARGQGEEDLEAGGDPKQMSRLTTLEENTRDLEDVEEVVEELSGELVERLEDRGWRYRKAAAVVITPGMDTYTRSETFKSSSQSVERLSGTVRSLLEGFLEEHPDLEIRRVGVRVSGFEKGQSNLSDFAG